MNENVASVYVYKSWRSEGYHVECIELRSINEFSIKSWFESKSCQMEVHLEWSWCLLSFALLKILSLVNLLRKPKN